MEVILVSSEVEPFMKSGGLGDFAGGLSKSLAKNNVKIKVIMPFYKNINLNNPEKLNDIKIKSEKELNSEYNDFSVFFKKVYNVEYYFINNDYCFNRDYIYGNEDIFRYTFFSKATLDLIEYMGWNPDILHLNDWHVSLIPLMLKYDDYNFNFKTLLTIHNLHFQSDIEPDVREKILNCFFNENTQLKERSVLEAGIRYSDKVTTVSPSYAHEISSSELGENLREILEEKNVEGILNGVNLEDRTNFGETFEEFLKIKAEEKSKVQEKYGLEINSEKPLIIYIGRLSIHKGSSLIMDVLYKITKNAQFILLGEGRDCYEKNFKEFDEQDPNFVANIEFNPEKAEELYRAADIFLMPSFYEPCGIAQLIALNNGTVPIVHNVGGLKDTINDGKNGFKFYEYHFNSFLNVINKSIDIYENEPLKWKKFIENALNTNYTWDTQSKEYIELYKKLINDDSDV